MDQDNLCVYVPSYSSPLCKANRANRQNSLARSALKLAAQSLCAAAPAARGTNADEEEALRILRQAQEDEAMAKRLQEELNSQEAALRAAASTNEEDTQLALRLQVGYSY